MVKAGLLNHITSRRIQDIAIKQNILEEIKWEKEHPGEKLLPSKHPLEILLEIAKEEKEEKENSENETVFDYCRKFIETEFGQRFLKHLLKSPYLEEALRIDLSNPAEWLLGYSADNTPKNKFFRWSVIYGLKVALVDDCIPCDYLGEGLRTIAHIYETHLDKNWSDISLWSDVETVIELLITKEEKLKKRYNIKEEDFPEWNDKTLKSFSEGLDIFELLLTKYFKAITKNLAIENNFLEKIDIAHQNSMRMRCSLRCSPPKPLMLPAQFLELLNNPDMVINYNYTDIAERIYKEQNNIRHVHINGEIYHRFGFEPSDEGFTTNIVIGYTNHNNSNVPKELYHFEKSSRRVVKNTEFLDLPQHIDGYDNFDLLIVGHSCCVADGDIIGDLLKHEKLKNALILCHTKDDLISINNNIRHILRTEPLKYGELMTHLEGKESHNLFYAVEQPKEQEKEKKKKKNKDNTEGIRELIKTMEPYTDMNPLVLPPVQ